MMSMREKADFLRTPASYKNTKQITQNDNQGDGTSLSK